MSSSLAKQFVLRVYRILLGLRLLRFLPWLVLAIHSATILVLMLREVVQRMLECLRESDSAARIGGDEFVVLLPLIDAASEAVAVVEKSAMHSTCLLSWPTPRCVLPRRRGAIT